MRLPVDAPAGAPPPFVGRPFLKLEAKLGCRRIARTSSLVPSLARATRKVEERHDEIERRSPTLQCGIISF
jgi:hypothetical protein